MGGLDQPVSAAPLLQRVPLCGLTPAPRRGGPSWAGPPSASAPSPWPTGHNAHEVSIRWFHGGIAGVTGRPTMGSWIVYALGSETQNLPAYMVLSDPEGHPVDGTHNWSSGFMPPLYQGTVLRPQEPRILNLDAPPHLRGDLQRQNLAFLADLNRRHLARHAGEADLEARIAGYELAAAMQTAAKEA